MTTSHVLPNPGYHDYTAQLQRAATNPHLLSSKVYREDTSDSAAASMAELSQIKAWSKRAWSGKDRSETTYQFEYPTKHLDEYTPSAPTEKERLNKPHPKP